MRHTYTEALEVLKQRRKPAEANELQARDPQAETLDAGLRDLHRWTQAMISLMATGRASQVRQTLTDNGLTETMEPLWHAARAESGEDLGPLPAEVRDAVEEVRRRVAAERD